MALQRIDSTAQVGQAGGYTQVRLGLDSQMEAQSWAQAGQAAQTGFDIIKREHDQDAIRQAQTDAPQAVKRDGTGMLIPVSDFSAPGGYFQSKAYKDAYRNQYFNTYATTVEQDHSNFLTGVMGRNPTDIVKAQAEMDERRNAVVAGLDPQYAPLITLKLNAMNGQAISRINGNAQQEKIKTAEVQAEYNYQNVVAQAVNASKMPAQWDEETIRLNHNQLYADFKKADELMISAGWTPERRAQKWKEARVLTEINADVQVIRQTTFNKGQLTNEAYGAWLLDVRQQAIDKAKTLGADGPAYLNAVSAAIGYASQTGQIQLQQQDAVVLGQQQENQLRRAQQRANPGRSMIPEDLLLIEQNDRNAIFTDSNLTSAQKVRGIAMIDQSIGQVKGDLVEFANSNITSLVNRARHIDTPNGQVPGILNELKQYVADPRIASWLPVASKNYAENQLATIATDSAKTDIATTVAMNDAGLIPRDDLQKWKERNPNYFGNHKLINDAAWANMLIKGDAAYRKRQYDHSELSSTLQNWQTRGTPPTPEQEKGLAGNSMTAFSNGGRGPWDLNDPDSRTNAASYFHQTGVIAAPAIAALKNMKFGTDDKQAASAVDMYGQLKTVVMDKYKNEASAIAFLNERLGDQTVEYLAIASRGNAEEAFKRVYGRGVSHTANAGGNKSMIADSLEAPFQQMLNQLGPEAGNFPTLGQRLGFSDLTGEDYFVRGVLQGDAPDLLGQLSPISRAPEYPHSGTYKSISTTDDIKKEIMFVASTLLENKGQLDNVAHPNVDYKMIALKQATLRLRGDTELVPDPKNPGNGVLQWKSAHTKIGEAMGIKVSNETVAGIAGGLHQHMVELDARMGVRKQYSPDIDWKSLDIVPNKASDGSLSYHIIAKNRHSVGIETLHEIPSNHPIFGAFAGDIMAQASKDLRQLHHGGNREQPSPGLASHQFDIDEKAEGWFGARAAAQILEASRFVTRAAMSPFMAQERSGIVNDYLQRMSDSVTGKDSRPPLDRWFNNVVGTGPYTPSTIDWRKTSEVLNKTADEGLKERAKRMEYLSRLGQRNPITFNPPAVPQ